MLLGKTSPNQEIYKIARINPKLDLTSEFNVPEDLQLAVREGRYTGVLNLKRGSKPLFHSHPDEKHFPFEKIGILF